MEDYKVSINDTLDLWGWFTYDIKREKFIDPDWIEFDAPIDRTPEVQNWLKEMRNTIENAKK